MPLITTHQFWRGEIDRYGYGHLDADAWTGAFVKKLFLETAFHDLNTSKKGKRNAHAVSFCRTDGFTASKKTFTKEFSPFPMERYAVFDLTSTQEEKGRPGCPNSMFNPEEAAGVVKLCDSLSRLLPTKKIGIATVTSV